MVNSFNADSMAALDPARRAAVERRQRLLGPAYRLFYQNPVELREGRGTRLFDSQGHEYLDAYNNVVSVGHCHPHVVQAVHRQLSTLCTHTRYIQEGILDYAETMLPSYGGRIAAGGHMMFTCTGSEANDLALRIAKHATGKRGIIITEEAYHGNSDLTAGISASLGEASPLGEWVRTVPAPDSYLGNPDALGQKMAEDVTRQAWHLKRNGDGLAAFIADSLFSSDGVFATPGVLKPVADAVRAAGGLFVADEVQSGFGRSGDEFWGFQRHGIDPDIVSMGKPMGNGYPVAGIAVVPDVVERFGRDTRYFNTFGGNGVAMAAAMATLQVVRDENLQANAKAMGEKIQSGFRSLAARFPGIGDVRGAGLYIGVEMVADRATKAADADAATRIVNGLREKRVLISATGPRANVLKIRPPLVFTDADVDWLLRASAEVMAEVLA
ncbi:aminotransferase class III-fold pyridoxal phosphate-dependent enzyme [Paracoccus sp. DK608]|uniref:Aminotransferase class III-fold pyridoxal phosphate-dependent enzyme n=2 Tax=Paracoccus shanxieyensis TaxID=2675752 RepID=A0A6L6IUQ1_9RHOB|nr:aminotransferase class III-fold pyridoxal phosphate-dependent enzyme [Paracoccus shanxieyensis]MTH88935.1 aminotransferase class III-fold pyridoxal phosphate-dependent enzyme [Paracoccus shanxieyensis]